MGEIAINPIHNVHKKYRTMNFVNPYIFALPVDLTTNTEIGGVASTISTPALLASKLGILESRITNFTVVGSDIKCKITGSYSIPTSAFLANSSITYYRDSDYLVNAIGVDAFKSSTISGIVDFQNAITVGATAFDSCYYISRINLKNATTIGDSAFSNAIAFLESVYIPSCTSLGSTSAANNVFMNLNTSIKIYTNPVLATNNAGSPDGDLTYAISRGATVAYVTSFVVPNPVTTLTTGSIYNTAIQTNFTPPTGSTNAIDFYDVYINGVFSNKITSSGGYAANLPMNTSCNITVYAIDIFYNKSLVSNSITQSTTNYTYTDTDANASISAKSLTGSAQESEYILITGLKSNSLYTKCLSIYTFKGSTAAQHKFNSKNPIDTNAAFRLTFNGMGFFSDLGYKCNGYNTYGNSYFSPSSQMSLNNNGLTLVCGTNNIVTGTSGNARDVGAYNSETSSMFISPKNTASVGQKSYSSTKYETTYTDTVDARGILTGVRQSSSSTKLFKNGILKNTSALAPGTLASNSIFIGAQNIGSAWGISMQRIQMVIFHEGLSDAEVATLHTTIDLSEAIAGRKTW